MPVHHWLPMHAPFVPSLLLNCPLGERLRLESLPWDRLSGLNRSAIQAPSDALFCALDRGELLT
jgi:hypothetical protein